ncbi:hypothetical protein [Synoicihabitans lomoniglobus]|uniref:DUF3592 domain-containing protein n=1 Tax=Synoicihabitans lomoniglobus TaxID=2909285 RepID=A0AAF0CPV9_9BACT|nr:hypothetical protein [Opitutaceae bacterium LMO-M01]WED65852.1 hypothetical protein PXH66_03190 [Opitutaceae bacterium LMO-M01]
MKVDPRARAGVSRLVVILALATVALGLMAFAFKRDGDERGAGLAGAFAFFVGIWTVLAAGSGRRGNQQVTIKELEAAYPDEPWHWRPDWHEGRIRGAAKTEAVTLAVMAVAFLGLSAPGVWAIPEELSRGNYPILLVLLFWVVGLGLAWAASKRARQFWRYGTLVFRPESVPGSIGGYVGGVISIPKGAVLGGDVTQSLQNVHEVVTGSGKHRSTRETILCERETVLAERSLAGTGVLHDIPVLFHVPRGEARAVQRGSSRERVWWRLRVTVPVRGEKAALTTWFDIPVFDIGENAPSPMEDEGLLAGQRVQTPTEFLAAAGVTETREGDTRVWRFHQRGTRAGIVVLGLAFVACVLVALIVPVWPIRIGCGFTALIVGAILPSLIWQRRELRISPRDVVVGRRTWWGWHETRMGREEVGDVVTARSMQSGGQQFYRLVLRGVAGIDPEQSRAQEHFAARKARYRWQRAKKQGRLPTEEESRLLRETPRFEFEVAGYLAGTRAAEQVRSHLLNVLSN